MGEERIELGDREGCMGRGARTKVAVAGAILVLCVVLLLEPFLCVGREPGAPVTAIYVWQQQWTDPVREGVARAARRADTYFVLYALARQGAGRVEVKTIQPDWSVLAAARVPVVLVIRVSGALDLAGDEPESAASLALAEAARTGAADARARGVHVTGLQVDYDCPASRLRPYGRLLRSLNTELVDSGLELSITALPSWLRQWWFRSAAGQVAYYVLQVHALEPPSSPDAPLTLYRRDKLAWYLCRASRVGVPYYVALPTYGYRVAFDPQGAFAGIVAEGPAPDWGPDYQVRDVRAEPAEVADIVRGLSERRPSQCRGVAWFRLPVDTDARNWSWQTLEEVMDGRAPAGAEATGG